LALLLLAGAAFPRQVRAATVDHRLRAGSAAEAGQAAEVCSRIGVPHIVLPVDVPAGASVQANARQARYAALTAWMAASGLSELLTAHHLDDQAETLMMRLLRGSGLAGLAGIRARRPLGAGADLQLLRPLLGWRRAELAEIAEGSGLPIAQDPSNADAAFDRVRIRELLAQVPGLDPLPLAKSAAALAEAEDALDATAAYSFDTLAKEHGNQILIRPAALPPELRRRLLLRCLRRCNPDARPRGEQVTDALQTLGQGGSGTLAGVMFTGLDGTWRFRPAPPRRLAGNGGSP
jgi:tRNA(Ile)-lysidine synthase